MNISGPIHKAPLTKSSKTYPARPDPEQESESLTEKAADLAEDTVRTIGGTAAVALKSSSLLTTSVLQGLGMEEEKADRIGTVASLVTWGTTVPLAIMGSGVIGTIAVKGLGLGPGAGDGAVGEMRSAYAEGVQETFEDGEMVADTVMKGVGKVTGKVQDKSIDLGQTAVKGLGHAFDYGKKVVGDVVGAAADTGDFLSSLWGKGAD